VHHTQNSVGFQYSFLALSGNLQCSVYGITDDVKRVGLSTETDTQSWREMETDSIGGKMEKKN